MVLNALSSYSFYYFLILSEEGERLLVLQKMHQHVSTHDGNIFFLKDPSDLVAVCEDDFDLLSVLLGCLADLAAGIAINGCTGFVCHADRGKVWLLISRVYFERFEFQSGLLVHLADSTLVKVLVRLYKPCREFIDVTAQRIAILADQNNLILLLALNTVNNHSVRIIVSGLHLEGWNVLCSGCHVIRYRCIMYAGRIYMVEIDETVVCKFLYIMNFSHIIENLLSCTNLP